MTATELAAALPYRVAPVVRMIPVAGSWGYGVMAVPSLAQGHLVGLTTEGDDVVAFDRCYAWSMN